MPRPVPLRWIEEADARDVRDADLGRPNLATTSTAAAPPPRRFERRRQWAALAAALDRLVPRPAARPRR